MEVNDELREYDSIEALPQRSSLRKQLNRALLEFMETDQWAQILKQYLG